MFGYCGRLGATMGGLLLPSLGSFTLLSWGFRITGGVKYPGLLLCYLVENVQVYLEGG